MLDSRPLLSVFSTLLLIYLALLLVFVCCCQVVVKMRVTSLGDIRVLLNLQGSVLCWICGISHRYLAKIVLYCLRFYVFMNLLKTK